MGDYKSLKDIELEKSKAEIENLKWQLESARALASSYKADFEQAVQQAISSNNRVIEILNSLIKTGAE